jgi:hypothetical protein
MRQLDPCISADFEHVADLPLAAWRGLAARFCALELPIANMRGDGAEVLVLDDCGLRNLTQLVKGRVGQVAPAVGDRQSAVGIILGKESFSVVLTSKKIQCLCVLAFINIESEWQHYKRQLSGNAPVETRAQYRDDRIHAMHYNGHTGRFITGAVFSKGDEREQGRVFLGLLTGPV